MSPFSSMSIVCLHLFFFYKLLVYKGFNFKVTHAHHLGSNAESTSGVQMSAWTKPEQ